MVLMIVDGGIQSQKSILPFKQIQGKGRDFASVFNQNFSKNSDSNKNSETTSPVLKQLGNSPETLKQNRNRAERSGSDQKIQRENTDMLSEPKDSNKNQQDFSNGFEVIFSLFESLGLDVQKSMIQEDWTFETEKNILLFDEQLSILGTALDKILGKHQTGLSKEQFSKISEILQFLSTESDVESCWPQIQKLFEELRELILSEKELDIQEDPIRFGVNRSDVDGADKDKIDRPHIGDIEQLADRDLIFNKAKTNFIHSNDTDGSEEGVFTTDDHANIELDNALKKQQDILENNMISREERGNVQPAATHPNNFNDSFVLENKMAAFAKPDIRHILSQVTTQAGILLDKKGTEMHLQLQPEHLGKLAMKIAVEKGTVVANIVVENQAVKQVLESNFSLLKDALNEKGFGIQGFHVSVGQDAHAHKHPNFMKFKKKNIGQALSITQNNEYKISELPTSTISLYATQIDYLG